MSSEKYFLFKLIIIFVIFIISVSSKPSIKAFGNRNSTKERRGLYHTKGVSSNGVTASNVPKVRNMKRSPLSDVNVGAAGEDNTVDDKVAPSGPTVTLSIDPALETTLTNAGDSKHAETVRKELMEKVLDSAMRKLKELVVNKGGNVSSIPTTFAPTGNRATTRKMPAVTRRFPTRQLSRTLPLIVRAPSTIVSTTSATGTTDSVNMQAELTTMSPNEESAEHSQEKIKVTEATKATDAKTIKNDKVATVVKLPPLHMQSSKLDINYADDDKSASKEILNEVLDKDQFWKIIEDEDESLDDTEEKENEELLRMLESKAKENATSTTTEDPKKVALRDKTTQKRKFDFRAPRKLRPEVETFFNSIRDFFVNIYNSLSGPWYKNLL